MGHLAVASSVCCYVNVLRRENGQVMRTQSQIEVDGKWRNWKPKKTLKKKA